MENYKTKAGKCDIRKCRACCCTDILIASKEELDKIREYIKEKKITPVNYSGNDYVNRCPFLGENLKCKIYPIRPESCQKFDCGGESLTRSMAIGDKHVISMLKEMDPEANIPYKDKLEKHLKIQEEIYRRRIYVKR